MVKNLFNDLYEIGLKRDWDKIEAKWGATGSTSLLAHSLTVVGITDTLIDVIGSFSESDRKVALAASFFHDMLKEGPSSREKVEKSGRLMDKHYSAEIMDEIESYLDDLGFSEEEIKQVVSILPHGALQGTEHLSILLDNEKQKDNPEVRRLVHELADVLASKKNLDEFSNLGTLKDILNQNDLELKYHKVSMIRGILTSILHEVMHKIYEKAGYVPLIYYPEGTLYVGNRKAETPDFSEFEDLYWDKLKGYMGDISEKVSLGQEAIGRVNATPVKSPTFAYLNEKTLNDFWEAARSQNAISNSNINGYDKIIDTAKFQEKEVMKDWLKEKVGLYYIFIYFKAVLEHCTNDWNKEEAIETLDEILSVKLQNTSIDKEDFLEEIKSLSHTKSKKEKLEIGKLLRNIFTEDATREEALDEAVEFCKSVTFELRQYADKYQGLESTNLAEQMKNEVSQPAIGSVSDIVEEVWEDYTNGKKKGTPVCVLCGRRSFEDATADLLGKSQTFSNFLQGGSRIAVGNKLRVCELCKMEMSIRTLFTKRAEFEEYYIIPQINLSPKYADLWYEIAGDLSQGQKRYGIDPITRDTTWADLIINKDKSLSDSGRGMIDEFATNLLENMWPSERRELSKSIKNAIDKCIEDEYGRNFQDFVNETGIDCENKEEVIELALEEDENVLWQIDEYLTQLNKDKIRNMVAMITPNYVLVSYPLRRNEKDDHKATNYLRHLFRGSLLSKLFLSSVIVKELRYEPLFNPTVKGAVKVPTNIQFDKVFSNTEVKLKDGWLTFGDVEKSLYKLSALFLLDEEISRLSSSSKSQKGNLITLLDDYPGRTLNRLQQLSSDKQQPNFKKSISLLNKTFEVEETK